MTLSGLLTSLHLRSFMVYLHLPHLLPSALRPSVSRRLEYIAGLNSGHSTPIKLTVSCLFFLHFHSSVTSGPHVGNVTSTWYLLKESKWYQPVWADVIVASKEKSVHTETMSILYYYLCDIVLHIIWLHWPEGQRHERPFPTIALDQQHTQQPLTNAHSLPTDMMPQSISRAEGCSHNPNTMLQPSHCTLYGIML